MQALFSTIIFLLVAWSIGPAQSTDNWIKLEPKDAGFRVMMPAKPIEQVSQNEKLTSHAYIAQLDTALYVANYSDYASSMKVSPEEELPAGRDSFNKNLKATLINSRNITLAEVPGIEFTSETPGATIRSKIFVKDHRTFQIAAVVPKNVDQAKTIQTFLDSFDFRREIIDSLRLSVLCDSATLQLCNSAVKLSQVGQRGDAEKLLLNHARQRTRRTRI
jgi:hypothetical protein